MRRIVKKGVRLVIFVAMALSIVHPAWAWRESTAPAAKNHSKMNYAGAANSAR
jgi:hypothetical protein